MRRRINAQLKPIGSGITVADVEMYEPTPPILVRNSFDKTQRAENYKQKMIRNEEKERSQMLSETVGGKHAALLAILDELENGQPSETRGRDLEKELDRFLDGTVEGRAGRMIKNAGAYLSSVVGQMQSDVELYRTLIPEYRRNPKGLIGRLWARTQDTILNHPGVKKLYRAEGMEIRLKIGLDPEDQRMQEQRRLEEKEFDVDDLRKRQLVPLGPEAG